MGVIFDKSIHCPATMAGLRKTVLRLAPLVYGLGVTHYARLTASHALYSDYQLDSLSDFAALISLLLLALPLAAVTMRAHVSNRMLDVAACLSSATLAAVLAILEVSKNIAPLDAPLVMGLLVLAYMSEFIGLYIWLHNTSLLHPKQIAVTVFAASMLQEALCVFVMGFFPPLSYDVAFCLCFGLFFCVCHNMSLRQESPLEAERDDGAIAPDAAWLIAPALDKRHTLAFTAAGVAMLALATSMIVGFMPRDYISGDYFLALTANMLLKQMMYAALIIIACRGLFWQLSFGLLQCFAIFIFTALVCHLVLGTGQLPLSSILANSVNSLLVALVFLFLASYMRQRRIRSQRAAAADADRGADRGTVHPSTLKMWTDEPSVTTEKAMF